MAVLDIFFKNRPFSLTQAPVLDISSEKKPFPLTQAAVLDISRTARYAKRLRRSRYQSGGDVIHSPIVTRRVSSRSIRPHAAPVIIRLDANGA